MYDLHPSVRCEFLRVFRAMYWVFVSVWSVSSSWTIFTFSVKQRPWRTWPALKQYFIAIPPPFLSTKKQIRQEWQLDKCFKGETIYFVSVPNISVQVLQTFYLNCVTPVASRASGGHGRKHRNLPIFASARFSSWQYFLWADFHTSTICFGPIFLLAIFSLSRFSY